MLAQQQTHAQHQSPTEQRPGTIRNEHRKVKSEPVYLRTLRLLDLVDTSLVVAGNTLKPTVHVHINYSGQGSHPALKRTVHWPAFVMGAERPSEVKTRQEHRHLVLPVFFPAGCSDPLVAQAPPSCITSISHVNKAFSGAFSGVFHVFWLASSNRLHLPTCSAVLILSCVACILWLHHV